MNEEITKAILEGTIPDDVLTALESKLSEAGKEELKKAQAFAAKRRDEENKYTKSELDKKAAEELVKQQQDSAAKLREETIQAAKHKLFSEYDVSAEKQSEYDEAFKKLDSGKMTFDNIYEDFKGVHAFLNRDSFLSAKALQEKMEAEAAERAASSASYSSGGASSMRNHDEESVKKFAAEAGVPVETAQRVLSEGYSRVL